MRNLRVVGLCLLAALAAVSCSGTGTPQAERREGGSGSAQGAPAETPSGGAGDRPDRGDRDEARWDGPDFTVETFDGEKFHLAAQAGTPVVLNFWESW